MTATARPIPPTKPTPPPSNRLAEYELAATTALDCYRAAADEHAKLCYREMALQAQKPIEKDIAIRRAMEAPNGDGKGTSYTTAERTVENDPAYSAFLRELRDVVRLKELAFSTMMATLRQTDLAIALIQVSGRDLVRLEDVS